MRGPPLDDAWRAAIDAVLRARGWPDLGQVGRLGPLVAKLSASYNLNRTAARDLLPARLAFSFARDVPKGGAAVRELVRAGRLACPPDRPLRILDLGAGLGATTWGVVYALEAAGQNGAVEATWIDEDAAALRVAADLLHARGPTPIPLRAATVAQPAVKSTAAQAPAAVKITAPGPTAVKTAPPPAAVPRGQSFDLVLLGQVLSELDAGLAATERVAKHAALVRELVAESMRADGSLVIIEPALRERTRHLHAVRDAVLAANTGDFAIGVFAPCLHEDACPALAHETDWCHEDLAIDLPQWLAPIARAAGLRWQGLTFSYLVLRKDGARLADRAFPWRVVSGPVVSKGKRELYLCGKERGPEVVERAGARVRVQRLDRHETPANEAWSGLGRGDCIRTRPPLGASSGGTVAHVLKVTGETSVDVDRASE